MACPEIKLTCPNDGQIASEVGIWAAEKHDYLCRYIDISRATRHKYLPNTNSSDFKGGATYIDLFCGPGRSKIKNSNDWIDGSPIVAWKASQKSGSAFSHIYISDTVEENLLACKKRLESLGAPVTAFHGTALEALIQFKNSIDPYGLHFSFIDPFNLKSLDYSILESLSKLKRMDILIHLSKMDLQRNLAKNLSDLESDFDLFIPGWRENIDMHRGAKDIRQQVIEYWKKKVEALGVSISKETGWKLITGSKNQPLYWLMLIAGHNLAHNFWEKAALSEQSDLFA
jgi:three-Cys-motif partner protein